MVKDDLRSIGHAGEAGRGNRATSPSTAARSLAGSGAKKKPAKAAPSPEKKPEATVPPVVAPPAAKKAKKAPSAKSSTQKPPGRPHLRAVPDEDSSGPVDAAEADTAASSASDAAADSPPLTDGLSLDDLIAAFISGAQRVLGSDWERQLATLIAGLRRRLVGSYEVDEFGLDLQILDILNAAVEPIAENWFRLQVRGIENIPADGGALLVANHSGTVPMDGLITSYAVRKHTGRPMRALGADLVFKLPGIAELARKAGATLACTEDAERLLGKGELAAVWPEGFKGVGKPFSERYKLQRFGRGGFVSSAMRAQVPIVPVSIVGAEEIYPLVGNIPSLARLLGVPYIPITPFFPLLGPLGLIPLPSKWIIEFGEPIRTDAYPPEAADDPMLLFNVTDQVRETIQQTLYTLLYERGNPFI